MSTPAAITDPTVATPVEIDTVLFDRITRRDQAVARAAQYRSIGERDAYSRRYLEDAERYEAEAKALAAEIAPLNAEFVRRGGWLRYFLVLNSNGHVHRGMDCNTCFDTTQYTWVTDLSDCNEDAAVKEFGELMCTVCFPLAPTNPDPRRFLPGTRAAAERDAKRAEKDAKAAAKREKQIFAEDGSLGIRYAHDTKGEWVPRNDGSGGSDWKVTGFYYRTVETKIAARNALSSEVQSYCYGGRNDETTAVRLAAIETLTEALERHGMDANAVIERANKKANQEGSVRSYVRKTEVSK